MSSVIVSGDTSGAIALAAPAVAGNNTLTLPAVTSTVATLLDVPPGVVFPYAGSSTPTGFLLCYGQAVSRTTYADLFTAISTTYGSGDGSTTFNVPDLRGRSIFGKDNMGGSAANRVTNAASGITGTTLGAVGGDQNMPTHTHGVTDPQHFHYYGVGGVVANGVNVRGTSGDGTNFGYVATNNSATGISINNAGSGTAGNMPPAMIMNFIIKV